MAAGLLVGIGVLQASGGLMLAGAGDLMRTTFTHLPTETPTSATLRTTGIALGLRFLLMMAPLFAALMIAGIVANVAQVGLLVSFKAITPKPAHINPLSGFKRIFGGRSFVELTKSIVKLLIVGLVAYRVFGDRYEAIVALTGADPIAAARAIADAVFEIGFKAGFGLFVVAVLDYGYQRWQFERSIRMTKQELRQEYKESDGDPQLKARIRRTQRQMAQRRMMQAVPTADVVVTNPTHIAVAIQYDPSGMEAPRVVAKGEELIAARIKTIAAEHGVPVMENKPLARALSAACEIGDQIPAELYQAVAEVLAFVFSLKRRRAGVARPPRPAIGNGAL